AHARATDARVAPDRQALVEVLLERRFVERVVGVERGAAARIVVRLFGAQHARRVIGLVTGAVTRRALPVARLTVTVARITITRIAVARIAVARITGVAVTELGGGLRSAIVGSAAQGRRDDRQTDHLGEAAQLRVHEPTITGVGARPQAAI